LLIYKCNTIKNYLSKKSGIKLLEEIENRISVEYPQVDNFILNEFIEYISKFDIKIDFEIKRLINKLHKQNPEEQKYCLVNAQLPSSRHSSSNNLGIHGVFQSSRHAAETSIFSLPDQKIEHNPEFKNPFI
jgi:hypothetical protein